ncbi:hypothetical protein DQ353_00280 [Arthrobacter sp. AQ5-05]|uniref:hypothetical protein n=1 Tax=Arthrobacter sp. AQ5-05 TaxID=2184581 RepID=UPI000DCEBE2E|nr:hypothetical protein [Arthrobacter sp. AQ5-05]RAX50874.1 hypothetical protein DQ353_00280 [Arthrobacter sp. AQ5-05]
MSRVEMKTVTTVRHEYRIEMPAYRKDIYEALQWADRDMKEVGVDNTFDDASIVTANDDHIIVYWEEKK